MVRVVVVMALVARGTEAAVMALVVMVRAVVGEAVGARAVDADTGMLLSLLVMSGDGSTAGLGSGVMAESRNVRRLDVCR